MLLKLDNKTSVILLLPPVNICIYAPFIMETETKFPVIKKRFLLAGISACGVERIRHLPCAPQYAPLRSVFCSKESSPNFPIAQKNVYRIYFYPIHVILLHITQKINRLLSFYKLLLNSAGPLIYKIISLSF